MSSWLQALKRQLTFKSPKRDARAFAEIVEPLVIYPYSQKLDVSEAFLTGSDKDILELSKSEAKICHDAEQSALRFFGYTSEKGYAAWRTRRSFPPSASFFVKLHAWDLSGYGKLHFRLKSMNNRPFFVNIQAGKTPRRTIYQHGFDVQSNDAWSEVTIPLSNFVETYQGQILENGRKLDTSCVRSIGMSLLDGKAGSFELLIQHIKMNSVLKLEEYRRMLWRNGGSAFISWISARSTFISWIAQDLNYLIAKFLATYVPPSPRNKLSLITHPKKRVQCGIRWIVMRVRSLLGKVKWSKEAKIEKQFRHPSKTCGEIYAKIMEAIRSRKYNVIEEHCTGDLAIVLKQQLQKVSKHMPTLDEVTSVKEKFFLVAQAGEQENEQLAQVVLRINSIYNVNGTRVPVEENIIFQLKSWQFPVAWKLKCRLPEIDPLVDFPAMSGPKNLGQPMRYPPNAMTFPLVNETTIVKKRGSSTYR